MLKKELEEGIVNMAEKNPWYGYKRIAVMCRRSELQVSDRQVYRVMKLHKLLQKRRGKNIAETYQAAKLFALLPQKANDLWQMDVTYLHIPGFGWYYAVTVIDYYSRYLLALHLTPSYRAVDCIEGLEKAQKEAEKIHGKSNRPVILVTDNGSSFLAKRFQSVLSDKGFSHVRIRYRTPTQLGLLERFHGTLKREEIYWNLYQNPADAREKLQIFHERYNKERPHWALRPKEGADPGTPEEVYKGMLIPMIPKWQGWARKAKEQIEKELEAA